MCKKILERFSIDKSKAVGTPIAQHFKLSKEDWPKTIREEAYMDGIPYYTIVGSLMYAMVWMRPDLCHVVSVVSKYMVNPRKKHWKAVKWILRYLRGTTSIGLKYGDGKETGEQIVGYVDF